MTHTCLGSRAPWSFPFYADYIAVIHGKTMVQRVKVLEKFSGVYKIKSAGNLRVPDLINPVPAGVFQTLPIEAVHDARRR
jgi:hypothetical protein